jgi:hypothetical protein
MLDSSDVETETCPPLRAASARLMTWSAPRFSTCTVTTSPGGLIDAPRSTDTAIICSSCSSSSVKVSV